MARGLELLRLLPLLLGWFPGFSLFQIMQICLASRNSPDPEKNDEQCTLEQALKKIGIKDFAKNDYLGSHFLKPELFQMKIFGCYLLCSFTFNLYLGMS